VLSLLDRAEDECLELRQYQNRFYEERQKAAVLGEKLRQKTAFEIVCKTCFGVGGIIVGLTPFLWNLSGQAGDIALLVGVLLMGGSVFAESKGRQ